MRQFTSAQISEIKKIVNDEVTKNLFKLPKLPPHKHDGVDNINIPQVAIVPATGANGSITFARTATYRLYFSSAGMRFINFNGLARVTSGDSSVSFNGPLRRGDYTMTLKSIWGGTTGARLVKFSSGEQRVVNFYNSSLTTTWQPPLTQNASSTATIKSTTKRALIVGTVQLSPVLYFQVQDSSSVKTGGLYYPLNGVPSQSCSSMFIDSTNIANTATIVSQTHFAYVVDQTVTIVAEAQVVTVTPSFIEIAVTVASGWEITGNFTIS